MEIKEYNPNTDNEILNEFYQKTDVENNKNMNALGYEKRHKAKMFFVMEKNQIIGMSYIHDFSEYIPDTWRVFTRTTILKEYRAKNIGFDRTFLRAVSLNAHSLPYQIDYGLSQGGKTFVFSTNYEDGMASSYKLGKYLRKIVDSDPRFHFLKTSEIYGVKQDIWRLNFRNIIKLEGEI